jgi:hypothetical protein
MWKKEDLQNNYVKLSSQQDYETVTKVLHEFGFRMCTDYKQNDKYYKEYPFLKTTVKNEYYLYNYFSNSPEIPIQQFYDYLVSKTLKVEDLVEGEVYSTISNIGNYSLFKCSKSKSRYYSFFISDNGFYDKTNNNWNGSNIEKNLKLASPEEKKWLEACIKADKFISKEEALKPIETKYEYEVVHCTTQEEWDFVLSKNSDSVCSIHNVEYIKDKCFTFGKNAYGTQSQLDWFKQNNSLIISFQEWCDKFNHKPDFKPKFEVGKWYKIKDCTATYRKCSKAELKGTYMCYSDSIDDGRFIANNNGSCDSSKDRLILLTDLSEIQQYLPDNHVDKIKVMKEENLVGRYLKALVDNPNKGTGVKAGEYGKIIKVTKNNEPDDADFPNFKGYAVSNDITGKYELMPIGFIPDNIIPKSTDTWIPEIGDWVYRINPGSIANPVTKDKVYQILEVSKSGKTIKVLNDRGGTKEFFDLGNFRKAAPHEIPSVVETNTTLGTVLNANRCGELVIKEYPITPKQAIKSIFDKDFNNPLNEVLELPKSSKKKTKQLIY